MIDKSAFLLLLLVPISIWCFYQLISLDLLRGRLRNEWQSPFVVQVSWPPTATLAPVKEYHQRINRPEKRGRVINDGARDLRRWCFPDEKHAREFAMVFGGHVIKGQ